MNDKYPVKNLLYSCKFRIKTKPSSRGAMINAYMVFVKVDKEILIR